MKHLLTKAKDNAGLLTIIGGVAAFAVALPQLEQVARVIRTTSVAYAAQEKNEQQDTILDRVTAVLEYQQRTQQQTANQQYKSNVIEWSDGIGGLWCCDESRQDCRVDENWWLCGK